MQASNFVLGKMGALRSLGKLTKGHQGQIVVKNALKVKNGLRVSRPNPKRASSGLGEIQPLRGYGHGSYDSV